MTKQLISTFTPLSLLPLPDKAALTDAFVGQPLSALRTPALIVDRKAFVANCNYVTAQAQARGLDFRAHVKTHKTSEGSRLQVEAAGGVRSLVCSTLPEVWGVIESGLVAEGRVDDILYSMPISEDRMEDLTDAQEKCGDQAVVRVMVDHADQVAALERAYKRLGRTKTWSAFIKVDGGGKRAGAPPRSDQMRDLVVAVLASPAVEVFGFYSHFGQSYASRDLGVAGEFYQGEIDCVNDAAAVARELGATGPFVLSVGATPTAHAAVLGENSQSTLHGSLELHAGCYCMNDLQQTATGLITAPRAVAISVLATVVSRYADRDEAMCDAGALAVSKDTGPFPGYGRVVSEGHEGWDLGRISQEHGTLVRRDESARQLAIGERVRIIPQHACLVCAGFPWMYVVDGQGNDTVVDVWVPWKGW